MDWCAKKIWGWLRDRKNRAHKNIFLQKSTINRDRAINHNNNLVATSLWPTQWCPFQTVHICCVARTLSLKNQHLSRNDRAVAMGVKTLCHDAKQQHERQQIQNGHTFDSDWAIGTSCGCECSETISNTPLWSAPCKISSSVVSTHWNNVRS